MTDYVEIIEVWRVGAMIHFGADGWRGRVDDDAIDQVINRIADAAGMLWERDNPGGVVCVTYDTRPRAHELARMAAEVLAARKLIVRLSDSYAPMPALSWAVAQDAEVCGGLMITGSHHPVEYVGVKFRMADGGCATPEFTEELEAAVPAEPSSARGPYHSFDIMTPYLHELTSVVDVDTIRSAHLKVVYDPMYGAARGTFASLLKDLGVEVRELHGVEDKDMEELHPDPVEPWADECEEAVVAGEAFAGLLNDGDADRVAAVDERGRYVCPDKIIALLLGHLVQKHGRSGRVAINLSSSVLIRRVAKSLGCRVAVKPIGFRHIYKEICKGDVIIGGEESGGIGFPCHMPERDGLLAALLLCEMMAKTGKPLGVLVDELEAVFGKMRYGRRDIRLEAEEIETLRMMLPGVNPPTIAGKAPAGVSRMDGVRFEFEDESWLLLRPSSTEASVRVYAEAATVEERDALLEEGCALARSEKVD